MTTLLDFLAVNEATLKSMSIADRLKLSHYLIEAVANALFGEQDSDDEDDGEDYECVKFGLPIQTNHQVMHFLQEGNRIGISGVVG